MDDTTFWSLLIPGCLLLLLAIIFTANGFGVIKLEWLNFTRLRELKRLKSSAEDPLERQALEAIIRRCNALNSKWILRESDLSLAENTYSLVAEIASAYHPGSKSPVEEARIRRVLKASMELKDRLLALTKWKGIHAVTQFRLRHVLFLSRAWKIKEEWKEWRVVKFLVKYKLYPLFKWILLAVRCLDLTFWAMKMMVYIIYDIVFKVFLVRWYLIVADLAIQVYRDKEGVPEVQPEGIMEDFDSMPDPESVEDTGLPGAVKKIADASRNDILFHSWNVEWKEVKEIYLSLIEDIARVHHPQADQPLYEAKLFDLLMGGVRFAEKIATIQTYPFLNKLLDLRVAHVLMAKDTADFLMDSQFLAWVRKYKLTYILKYSSLLFKVVRRGHPALLFRDFAFTLVGEGCKRWFYLYLHDKVAVEANLIYQETRTVSE